MTLGAGSREGAERYAENDVSVTVRAYPRAVSARALSAFAGDATVASALEHPNIERVLRVGAREDGAPFVVVERLRGETLRELLARRGPLRMAEARAVIVGVMAGLSAAHAVGLTHGALGVDDVFLVDGDVASVKLLNFGVRHLFRRRRRRWGRRERRAFSPLGDQRALMALTRAMLSGSAASPCLPPARAARGQRGRVITWLVAVIVSVAVLAVGGWLSARRANEPARAVDRVR